MAYTQLSPQAQQRRQSDLERMREKFARDKRFVKRRTGTRMVKQTVEVPKPIFKTIEIDLPQLAHACRVAKSLCRNAVLIEHLEIAATYFDDAAASGRG